MAKGKNRNRQPDLAQVPPGAQYVPCWPYWLTAHAVIHGGGVALALNNTFLGVLETVAHWIIDFLKCDNVIDVETDQLLHILCKLAWWGISISHVLPR